MALPECKTLLLERRDHALYITLNRPQARNAMNRAMVGELTAVLDAVEADLDVRALVLRGSDGHFCAGGDIKDMATAHAAAAEGDSEAFYRLNRSFGELITRVNAAPQVVVAALQGAVMGGGFGLACVSDVALADQSARFGLPETSLGIPPAQIAPFVASRIGLTQARRLALLGLRIGADEAARLGIVHEAVTDAAALSAGIDEVLAQLKRCAPVANRVTKSLLLATRTRELEALLDDAAAEFARAVTGPEGGEGTRAFVEKRPASWNQ
ncbi:enoyl-CoA hydratase/isomerase family protein [Exilibacterium tricleocarpae]|uniref:Enoyl-CoA hydratase/isomerase family protein n=1 Tax=Exilibacterium tricleocarpae TaxID=2591008 RepID=A0A545TYY4_9GAMM|nr:enoyl-CoA hydratase/isomerase family protein [Exilibacterium tricleocarpae]TQV82439.1 enoyl-CoA hydratase/isomerase family protein [Exilibacterium tricleocarpae]